MGHFAEIDENKNVVRVLVVDDIYNDDESGQKFLAETCGLGGTWKKTSYNTHKNKHMNDGIPFRGNFAGIGMIYDETLDAFYSKKPHESWIFNKDTLSWEAPIPMPTDGNLYIWSEEDQNWNALTN